MIKNLGKFGLLLFLLAHPAILVAVFVFIFLGIINWHLALLFTGMIAFEAVSIAFLMRIKLNKTIFNLGEMENKIQDLKEDADVLARMQRELIYAGHQIKTLQVDLDALRKINSNGHGNDHSRRTHIPSVSQS